MKSLWTLDEIFILFTLFFMMVTNNYKESCPRANLRGDRRGWRLFNKEEVSQGPNKIMANWQKER
jgi:hypothetical protein